MADLNQGARTARRRTRAHAADRRRCRALFHPDCDRRPWDRTRSADPAARLRRAAGARGLVRIAHAITAGGEFHPALRTLPAPAAPARAAYAMRREARCRRHDNRVTRAGEAALRAAPIRSAAGAVDKPRGQALRICIHKVHKQWPPPFRSTPGTPPPTTSKSSARAAGAHHLQPEARAVPRRDEARSRRWRTPAGTACCRCRRGGSKATRSSAATTAWSTTARAAAPTCRRRRRSTRRACVRAYPVVEKHRFVWVWPGDPALADPAQVPDLHWNDDPAWAGDGKLIRVAVRLPAGARQPDGPDARDLRARRIIGKRAVAEAPFVATHGDRTATVTRWMEDIEPPPFWAGQIRHARGYEGKVDRWQIIRFEAPCTIAIDVGVAPGRQRRVPRDGAAVTAAGRQRLSCSTRSRPRPTRPATTSGPSRATTASASSA